MLWLCPFCSKCPVTFDDFRARAKPGEFPCRECGRTIELSWLRNGVFIPPYASNVIRVQKPVVVPPVAVPPAPARTAGRRKKTDQRTLTQKIADRFLGACMRADGIAPSVEELMQEFGCGRATVYRAIRAYEHYRKNVGN
jgi:hypothetical protein